MKNDFENNKTTVWTLEEDVNEYDQHGSYTRCIWQHKPTLETIAKSLNLKFPNGSDFEVLKVVGIWKGEGVEINNSTFTLIERKFDI